MLSEPRLELCRREPRERNLADAGQEMQPRGLLVACT